MSKPNRYEVAQKVDVLEPATIITVAESLDAKPDSKEIQSAFEGAERHGLIQAADSSDPNAEWSISDKGRRKVADKLG